MNKFGVFLVLVDWDICKGKFIFNFDIIGLRIIIEDLKVNLSIFLKIFIVYVRFIVYLFRSYYWIVLCKEII